MHDARVKFQCCGVEDAGRSAGDGTDYSPAKCVTFHPRRPWLLSGHADGAVRLWDHHDGRLLARLACHRGPVRAVACHGQRQLVVTGGDDTRVKVWSCEKGPDGVRCLFVLRGHEDYVRSVAFHDR